MIKKIAQGYGNLIGTALKIIVLLALCSALGALFVIPLWKFATTAPKAYTAVILTIIALAACFIAVQKARSAGPKKTIRFLLKLVTIIGGFSVCILLVLLGKAIFAIPVLVLMIILYGIISFGTKKLNGNSER